MRRIILNASFNMSAAFCGKRRLNLASSESSCFASAVADICCARMKGRLFDSAFVGVVIKAVAANDIAAKVCKDIFSFTQQLYSGLNVRWITFI